MLARFARRDITTRIGIACTRMRTLATTTPDTPKDLPLSGVRVLELGQLVAGPFAGQLLGHFGAEVIKVEPPSGGDPLRVWRELDVDGVSPWFRSLGRNKKSVTIDMRKEDGRALVKKLALESDVIIENFKPGTLEKWGLGPADLQALKPSLIFTRISGYGQTGPWAKRPGYAGVCEAEAGFRYINGFPDPETALLARCAKQDNGLPGGSTVDVSLVESLLNLMEGIIPEYDRKGKVRQPSGSSLTGIVPTNAFPCLPSPETHNPTYVIIGGNGDTIYERLMRAIGRVDLTGTDFARNPQRVARQAEIEGAIVDWTRTRRGRRGEERVDWTRNLTMTSSVAWAGHARNGNTNAGARSGRLRRTHTSINEPAPDAFPRQREHMELPHHTTRASGRARMHVSRIFGDETNDKMHWAKCER
ncbi:hypothetical protein EWM64_g4543 [Hericium alpestre]|uniref:Uncharacterized protein n=1 Tax=Hericium alpestre TaxID=135208 RepID=A0A4Z0A105_9AGAM|nr:hypothetical protein EWM64_g4543 [Hericium alpestre]